MSLEPKNPKWGAQFARVGVTQTLLSVSLCRPTSGACDARCVSNAKTEQNKAVNVPHVALYRSRCPLSPTLPGEELEISMHATKSDNLDEIMASYMEHSTGGDLDESRDDSSDSSSDLDSGVKVTQVKVSAAQ